MKNFKVTSPKKDTMKLTFNIEINITLWQAIKLRIAGKHIREYVEGILKEGLDKSKGDVIPPDGPWPREI